MGGMTASAGMSLPTLAVVGGGLLFGWEIGHASGLSDWASGKLLGLGQPNAAGTITGGNWVNYSTTVGSWSNDDTGGATGDKIWGQALDGLQPVSRRGCVAVGAEQGDDLHGLYRGEQRRQARLDGRRGQIRRNRRGFSGCG